MGLNIYQMVRMRISSQSPKCAGTTRSPVSRALYCPQQTRASEVIVKFFCRFGNGI